MRLSNFSKVNISLLIFVLSMMSTGCPKPPKPTETRCEWVINSQGRWEFKCSVVWKLQAISDVRDEVNNYRDIDIADIANPWAPDTTVPSQSTITITTDSGYVATSTYETVYDSVQSSWYGAVDSQSTPRAYIARDPTAVRNFINDALNFGASTVDIQIDHIKPTVQVDPNPPSGTYTHHVRSDSSGGVAYYGSEDFSYGGGGGGGLCQPGMICQ